jgi:hypothetical protein
MRGTLTYRVHEHETVDKISAVKKEIEVMARLKGLKKSADYMRNKSSELTDSHMIYETFLRLNQ